MLPSLQRTPMQTYFPVVTCVRQHHALPFRGSHLSRITGKMEVKSRWYLGFRVSRLTVIFDGNLPDHFDALVLVT